MTYRPVIGLSGKARHGKDSTTGFLAEALREHGLKVRSIGFAECVREEARELHGWDGQKNEFGRTLLQNVGMNRRKENPRYWINKCFDKIEEQDTPDTVWIITDVRFRNEADAIQEQDGEVWRVVRWNSDGSAYDNGLTAEQKQHPSEVELDDFEFFDLIIQATDLEELEESVYQASKILYD